ncbi:hypothetical protein ABIE09_000684 [Lysobacter enzymogenes]|nr:hypothetical protein SAMN05421681_105270 [Lysobacter enzymogenes]
MKGQRPDRAGRRRPVVRSVVGVLVPALGKQNHVSARLHGCERAHERACRRARGAAAGESQFSLRASLRSRRCISTPATLTPIATSTTMIEVSALISGVTPSLTLE